VISSPLIKTNPLPYIAGYTEAGFAFAVTWEVETT